MLLEKCRARREGCDWRRALMYDFRIARKSALQHAVDRLSENLSEL